MSYHSSKVIVLFTRLLGVSRPSSIQKNVFNHLEGLMNFVKANVEEEEGKLSCLYPSYYCIKSTLCVIHLSLIVIVHESITVV